jgi:hypothetical protein
MIRDVLPGVQSAVSRKVGDLAGEALLQSFDVTTPAGERGAARMRSAASGPAGAWLTALPGAPTTRLGDAAFVFAGQHLLGLGPQTAVAAPPCLCGAEGAANPDHAMVCALVKGMASLRHDLWASAWRRVIRKAGCASSAEPAYSGLRPRQGRGQTVGLHRGDILAVLPAGRVVVLDCVVTHPAAASHRRAAARAFGAAAAKAAQGKVTAFRSHQGACDYEFVPLAVESYGRLGVDAARFLSQLGDIAAEDGRVSKERFVRSARQELSVALCRGNGHMYFRSTFEIAHRAGRAFLPGCVHPLDEAGDV